MIASAIGLFLIGGVGKVYIDSKNTFNARSAVAAATENYRFSFQDMRRTLVMAGRGIPASADGDLDNGTFPGVGPDGAQDPAGNGSSTIAVRYASGPAPCGMADDVTSTIMVRFYVDNDGNLVCEVPDESYAQPLVSGIDKMIALYGVDTDGDGIANQYITAAAVDSDSRWINVVSIRIGIVSGSGDGHKLPTAYQPSTPEPLEMLGMDYVPTETDQAFKSASTTISLRNLHHLMNRQ
jgi:type IV pilus assembly protein PilW